MLIAIVNRAGLRQAQGVLRKAGARTKKALWNTLGTLLAAFSPSECRNYLTNSGYECD